VYINISTEVEYDALRYNRNFELRMMNCRNRFSIESLVLIVLTNSRSI